NPSNQETLCLCDSVVPPTTQKRPATMPAVSRERRRSVLRGTGCSASTRASGSHRRRACARQADERRPHLYLVSARLPARPHNGAPDRVVSLRIIALLPHFCAPLGSMAEAGPDAPIIGRPCDAEMSKL